MRRSKWNLIQVCLQKHWLTITANRIIFNSIYPGERQSPLSFLLIAKVVVDGNLNYKGLNLFLLYYFIKHFTHFILSSLSNTTEYEKDHVESRPKKTGRHPSPEEGEESSDEQPTVDGGGEKAAEGFGPPRGEGGSF